MQSVLRLIRVLLRHPRTTCLVILASVGIAAGLATKIEIRFQFSDFYDHPKNPDMPAYRRYLRDFGDLRAPVILIESADVFAANTLAYVDELSRALRPGPRFARIRSLSTVNLVRATDDGVESGPLLAHLPRSQREVEELRREALASKLLVRRLVSADSRATAIVADTRQALSQATIAQQEALLASVSRVLSAHPPPPGVHARVSGAPTVEVETTHALLRDQQVLSPAVVLLLVIMLFTTFRSWQGVLLPMAAITVSTVWTLGVFGAFGGRADLVASIIPTTLLVYGVVDPVFVFTRYLTHLDGGLPRQASIEKTLSELMLPCFLTSLSTALGFAAFVTATLPTIRNFGLVVALGVSLSFVTTVTVLPVLLLLFSPAPRPLEARRVARWLDGMFASLWQRIRRQRGLVMICALALIGIGASAFLHSPIANLYVGSLPDGPAERAARFLERQLSGVTGFAVYFEGPPESMRNPAVLRLIDEVDRFAGAQAIVRSSIAPTDLLEDVHRAFDPEAARMDHLPRSSALTAQYLSLIDPDDRADFFSDDASRTHIRIMAVDRGSQEGMQFFNAMLREVAARHFERFGIRATVTGSGLAYRELDRLVREVLVGFAVAFGIIVLLQAWLFRSLRIALASVIPNLVPVAAAFITMRLCGWNLRIDNSLVLCVSIGGLFNTTIHIVARILAQLRAGASDPDEIMERALRSVGPPALYTAFVLSVGFSILTLSEFHGFREFGILCAVTLLSGFVSDVIVTSTIMRWLLSRPHVFGRNAARLGNDWHESQGGVT